MGKRPTMGLALPQKRRKSNEKPSGNVEKYPHIGRIIEWLLDSITVTCSLRFMIAFITVLHSECQVDAGWSRFESTVVPAGGPDRYVMQKYQKQAVVS